MNSGSSTESRGSTRIVAATVRSLPDWMSFSATWARSGPSVDSGSAQPITAISVRPATSAARRSPDRCGGRPRG